MAFDWSRFANPADLQLAQLGPVSPATDRTEKLSASNCAKCAQSGNSLLTTDDVSERAAIIAEGVDCAPELANAFVLILAAAPPAGIEPDDWARAMDGLGRLLDSCPNRFV